MSARTETIRRDWSPADYEVSSEAPNPTRLQALFRDAYEHDSAELDRKSAEDSARSVGSKAQSQKHRAARALRDQWAAWSARRDVLANEIRRGREVLNQVQEELATLRNGLEDWPGYERVCGVNPLPDYLQSIALKEGVRKFLPDWLGRREAQLQALDRRMKHCAKQNGFEHAPLPLT